MNSRKSLPAWDTLINNNKMGGSWIAKKEYEQE